MGRVDDSYLDYFCKILRPDYKLPNRKNIGGVYSPGDDTRLYDRLVNYDSTLPDFWRLYRNDFPLLYPLGLRIFSLVCSSASAERNFSIQGFIHSELRNRLESDKVMKQAYIKSNMFLLEDKTSMHPALTLLAPSIPTRFVEEILDSSDSKKSN